MDSQERASKIENYGKAYDYLVEAIKQFPQEMWQFQPASGWSIHNIIVHITDSEANSFVRCRRLIAEPGSTVMGYAEDVWAKQLNYPEQSTDDAIELFRLLRLTSYKLIKSLPASTWSHTVEHSDMGTMTMDDWLEMYNSHVPDHVRQMQEVFKEWQQQNG